jgi:hypothetical protein
VSLPMPHPHHLRSDCYAIPIPGSGFVAGQETVGDGPSLIVQVGVYWNSSLPDRDRRNAIVLHDNHQGAYTIPLLGTAGHSARYFVKGYGACLIDMAFVSNS